MRIARGGKKNGKRYRVSFLDYPSRVARENADRAAAELVGKPLTLRQIGKGFRIDCNLCGWTSDRGSIPDALAHTDTH